VSGLRSNPVDNRYLKSSDRGYRDRMNAKSKAIAHRSRGNLAYRAAYNPSGVVPKSMQGDPLQNNYQYKQAGLQKQAAETASAESLKKDIELRNENIRLLS
jgi:hypothetical protein